MKLSHESIGSALSGSDRQLNLNLPYLQSNENNYYKNKKHKTDFLQSIYSTLKTSKKFNQFSLNNERSKLLSPTYSSAKNIFIQQSTKSDFNIQSLKSTQNKLNITKSINKLDLDEEVNKLSNCYYDTTSNKIPNPKDKVEKREIYRKYRINESLSRDEISEINSKIKTSSGKVQNESRKNITINTTENKLIMSNIYSNVSKMIIKADYEDYSDPHHAQRKLKANKQIHDRMFNLVTHMQIDLYGKKYEECVNVDNLVKKMPHTKIFSNAFKNKNKHMESSETGSQNEGVGRENKEVHRNEILLNMDYFAKYSPFSCSRPPARSQSTFTMIQDEGKAYLVGGVNIDRLIDFWKCDLNDFSWRQIPVTGEFPLPRMGHSSVIYKNKIYIFGGNVEQDAGLPKEDLTIFSIDNNKIYTEKCENRQNVKWRRNHIGECIANFMFIHGGIDETGEFLSDFSFMDLDSLKWKEVICKEDNFKPYPVAFHSSAVVISIDKRYHHSFTLFKFPDMPKTMIKKVRHEGVYIFGGIDKQGSCNNELRVLKVGKRPLEWVKIDPSGTPPFPRFSSSLAFYEELEILIMHGGKNNYYNPYIFNDVFVFDLLKICWIQINIIDAVPKTRAEHCSLVYNNKLIIFGGTNSETFLGSDIYLINLDYSENKKKKTDLQILKYQNTDSIANKNKNIK